jgi:hypothetical protein
MENHVLYGERDQVTILLYILRSFVETFGPKLDHVGEVGLASARNHGKFSGGFINLVPFWPSPVGYGPLTFMVLSPPPSELFTCNIKTWGKPNANLCA